VAATFVNHNHFAAYLELLLPVGAALWLAAPLNGPQRFLTALSTALMAVGVILSCSRGAWVSLTLATGAGLGWLWTRRGGRKLSWRGVLIAIGAVAVIGFLANQPSVLSRGMSLVGASSDPSFQARQAVWKGAWDLVKERPLVGHGLGSFVFEFPRYRPAGSFRLVTQAFNDYLQLAAELGLVGVVMALAIALLIARRIVRLIRLTRTPWKRVLGVGGLVGLSSIAVHSAVDYPLQIPAVAFTVAAVAGLLTGIRYHADPSPPRALDAGHAIFRSLGVRWAMGASIVAGLAYASPAFARLIVADRWAQQGRAHREAGDLESAIASYRAAIRSAPRWPDYHRELGESLSRQAWQRHGHERRAALRQAAEAHRNALTLVPRDARSAHALGEALHAMGEFAEAERWLLMAVTRDPRNPLYWKHWAELKMARGEAGQAAEAFTRAAGLARPYNFFPYLFHGLDDPAHFTQRGSSELFLGRVGLAQTSFAIAAQLDPANPAAQVGLALCALSRGDGDTARRLMAAVHHPLDRAQWFAGLAAHHLKREEASEARVALDTSLKLDPSNVLARHLQIELSRTQQDARRVAEATAQLLALNRPPVFVQADELRHMAVVWEPEQGAYEEGRSTRDGWTLGRNGAIRQPLAVPPGRVRFRVLARGKSAQGLGPSLALAWSGRLLLMTEVASDSWTAFDAEAEVRPGESLLSVNFVSDLTDLALDEYRTLKVEKIVASWESL
jgi:tetratricopeptide (TPR) repeat protein